jgi:hypothetical protein
MPIAEATNEAVRRDLESCPGGFVLIRKMTFAEKNRHDAMQGMSVENPGRGKKVNKIALDFDVERQVAFALATCVVDHNLEKRDGSKYNFKSPADIASLDSVIGNEIGNLIDELNSPTDMEAEDENGDTFPDSSVESTNGEAGAED